MNQMRSKWCQMALATAGSDENAQVVVQALHDAVTGLSPVARTNWWDLSKQTGLDRRDVLDVIEDLTEARLLHFGKLTLGYKLRLPEAIECEV